MISGSTLILGDSISVGYGPLLPVSGGLKSIVAKVGAPSEWLLAETEKIQPVFDNVLLLIGTNDVGGPSSAEAIYGRITQIARRFPKSRVFLMTVPPLKGWANYASRFESIDAKRRALNAQICQTPGVTVVDLSSLLADPSDPSKLAPAFDGGDHLHPKPAALAKLLDSVISTGLPSPSSPPSPPSTPPAPPASSSFFATLATLTLMGTATWWLLRKKV